MKFTKKSYAGLLVKSLLLGTLAIAVSINPLVLNEAVADPLDKKSPKIAHGMYRDRGKSSPKIAHGMYRDRGKSSPKIAERMRNDVGGHLMVQSTGMYRDRGKSSPKIAHGMYRDRGKSSPKIAERTLQSHRYLILDEIDMALEMGEFEMADELLYELNRLERFGR